MTGSDKEHRNTQAFAQCIENKSTKTRLSNHDNNAEPPSGFAKENVGATFVLLTIPTHNATLKIIKNTPCKTPTVH